ncbi:NAD-dependent epimerase/dehydratase family protein [Qipengyuania huizhouensis]|uniref:NAD-dependent epimerase/dehydratase family protein n=1 Tax=Qipengyuania huizhouensis TaxID=2867245 RepID=UPI001C86831C|nr:NAD(P)-dependent oxidoreductase [Qipengyuania huizhouensis]MBX7460388.1 NAD(P)-dependent oxidoreductase [Qipengyuania huizhouensis]
MSERIVLVGASGRVGQLVSVAWQQQNFQSPQFVRQFRGEGVANKPDQLSWDPMEGSGALRDWTETYGEISAMIVLAGTTPRTGQDLSLNATIADRCIVASRDAEVPRVLMASSSAVYGIGGNNGPILESSICKPLGAYGEAKLEMERVCIEWRQRGVDVSCLRIGNVAGADALLLNLIEADEGAPVMIDIYDDGMGPIRSYLGPESLANVLSALATSSRSLPSVINIAAPAPIAMEELANSAGHLWAPRYVADNSTQRIVLDCSLLGEFYSFSSEECKPAEMVRQWKNVLEK